VNDTVEFAPQPIVRRRRLIAPALVSAGLVCLLVAAIVKPWMPGPSGIGAGASGEAARQAAVQTATGDVERLDPGLIASIARQLAARSGSWGVGSGGSGPRLIRDDPWYEWVPVEPVSTTSGAQLGVWPDTGLCSKTPSLLGGPRLVAVTAPQSLVPDWRLVGWWSDGSSVRSLDGVVRQISPPGNRGISYLERGEGAPWPDGRYEFDVIAGSSTIRMLVCLESS
jgi:hypothetical protein